MRRAAAGERPLTFDVTAGKQDEARAAEAKFCTGPLQEAEKPVVVTVGAIDPNLVNAAHLPVHPTVLERTREIGVRRALGARRRDIRFQFVVEAFALSAVGGLMGIVLGIAIAKIVAASAGWPTVVTAWSLLLSTGVSAAVGLPPASIRPSARPASTRSRRSGTSRGK